MSSIVEHFWRLVHHSYLLLFTCPGSSNICLILSNKHFNNLFFLYLLNEWLNFAEVKA